jgi:hypothetical protein
VKEMKLKKKKYSEVKEEIKVVRNTANCWFERD